MSSDQAPLAKKSPDQRVQEATPHIHKILIVDDEEAVGRSIKRILKKDNVTCVYAENGKEGLSVLKGDQGSFSLIITDQNMPGMAGTDLLSQVKILSPETVRYLITSDSDLGTIITAVNQGAVQHYISKPWDTEILRQAILDGIATYEKHLDSEKLLHLAKRQNAKLYELNCELVEKTKSHEKKCNALDKEIASLTPPHDGTKEAGADPEKLAEEISDWLAANGKDALDQLTTLKAHTMASLFQMVSDLALRNGIEMPEPALGGDHD